MKTLFFLTLAMTGFSAHASSVCRTLTQPKAHQMTSLKVAVAQYEVQYDLTYDQFMARIRMELRRAIGNSAELLILPELAIYDLIPKSISDDVAAKTELFKHIARDISPRYFADMKELAQTNRINILAGSAPIYNEAGQIVNRAMLFFANGDSTIQEKNFLTPEEREYGWSNSAVGKIQAFDTPWGKTAMMICHDCEFAHLSQQLAAEKPEVILVPSMTSNEHGRNRVLWTGMARAVEHYAYVVVVGTSGEPGDFFGQANVISPQDGAFPTTPTGGPVNEHGQFYYTLDLAKLRKQRLTAPIYPARDYIQGEKNATP